MKKDLKGENGPWQVAHIIIYDSAIDVGCGGLTAGNPKLEAYPVLKLWVDLVNQVKLSNHSTERPSVLYDNPGTYFTVKELTGYSTKAAEILIKMLMKVGWELGEIIDCTKDRKTQSQWIDHPQLLYRIYIHRN